MERIKTLNDLVALGIQLKKQDLPNGFICTIWAKKEDREQIYSDLIDEQIDYEYWQIKDKEFGAYSFKILGIKFLLF
jgi:hypothetical protein